MDAVIGRVAYVDLGTGKIDIESIPDESFEKFLGGRGLGAKIMLENVETGIEPLSPANILILATGPVTGTAVQGSDRISFVTKSPLTGLLFISSMGGRFGSTLKQAGFDALVIRGKANKPKYVFVNKAGVEIRNAEELASKSTKAVLATLSTMMKDFEVCTTGIAAENSVRYANIVHPRLNHRHGVAGRGGLGAVMASKNLKAIVAQRDDKGGVRVHSEKRLKDVRQIIRTNINAETAFTKGISSFGTARSPYTINRVGALGTRNLTDETFEYADSIAVYSDERLRDVHYRKSVTCHGCPVACGKLCELTV